MKPKKLLKTEKKTFQLLEDFDAAARDWGWTQDQGTGSYVHTSEQEYNGSKKLLIDHINRLHKQIRQLKVKVMANEQH